MSTNLTVTRILKGAGLIDDTHYAPGSAQRGTAIHTACAYYDKGELDESALDNRIKGPVESWKKFINNFWKRKPFTYIENRMACRYPVFTGQPDRVYVTPQTETATIIDLKSGGPEPWHCLQLAGYAMLVEDNCDIVDSRHCTRMSVYLSKEGHEAKVNTWEDSNDFEVFASCTALVNWKLNNGYLKEGDL